MYKTIKTFLAIAVFLLCFAGIVLADELKAQGNVSKVVVYRGQALVTREIKVDLPAGLSELIVTNLPEKIISDSIYAQISGDVQVLSVRYQEKEVAESQLQQIRELEAQIEEVTSQISRAEKGCQNANYLFDMYRPFWKLTLDAVGPDLNRALLQAEPIEKLTTYLEGKSVHWHERKVELEENLTKLRKDLNELNKRLRQLTIKHSRVERQAVLFLNNTSAKKVTVQLNYLVSGANWAPQYNFRADSDKSQVSIEYNALVNQTSGENWDDVSLVLSTAQPTMVSASPILEPMSVRLISNGRPAEGLGMVGKPLSKEVADAEKSQISVSSVKYVDLSESFKRNLAQRQAESKKGRAAQVALNQIASKGQMLEFYADEKAVKSIQQQAKISRIEGVSVSYNLVGRLSLPSRTAQQLVSITLIDSKANFTMIATPLLTDYVYRQAELVNQSDKILLAGQVSMYFDGDFVGKERLGLVTMGQKFTVGFGIDSQIRISREFEDKKTDTLWGNFVEKYSYRIAVDNYKNEDVALRLFERIPYTEDEALWIGDFETNTSLSEDKEYLRTLHKKGVLRWDLNLKANSSEKNASVITYGFTMKYDNDMQIRACNPEK